MVTMGRMQIVFSFITICNKIFFSFSENCNHSQVLEKKWLIQKNLAYGKHAPKLNRINYSEHNRVLMVLNDLLCIAYNYTESIAEKDYQKKFRFKFHFYEYSNNGTCIVEIFQLDSK